MGLFGNKVEKQEEEKLANSSNRIGKGTTITGDVDAHGNIRLEGKVIGNIKSKSKVVIGEGAQIEGNVYAQNAEIEGHVSGVLEIKDLLVLKPTAVVDGDIFTNKMIVDAGAKFNGQCKMGENAASGKNLNTANANGKATPQAKQKATA